MMEMEQMETAMTENSWDSSQTGCEATETPEDAARTKKRAAPLRMTKEDVNNVLKEIRRYPKKDTDTFITKRETIEILAPGIKELYQKKGYNEREIVGILKGLKAYNYSPKEIAVVVGNVHADPLPAEDLGDHQPEETSSCDEEHHYY